MDALAKLMADKSRTLTVLGFAVVTLHLVNASLFHLEAPWVQCVAWAALALFAGSLVTLSHPRLNNRARGVVALAYGLPALSLGIGVHAIEVFQVGVKDSSFTGVPMLLAGAILTVSGTTILVRSVHAWWRRLVFVPAGAVYLFFGFFPVTLGVGATNVAQIPCCSETPADRGSAYEDVTFETELGYTLSAWFIPSTNGATIITVHGAGTNRSTVLDEAEILVRHGYGVLMVDIEGFGDSGGRANAFGWLGARDVHAATAYLATRPEVDSSRIGGLGLSMGGEVLLHAAGESTDLRAIVAEGATGRTAADFRELKGSEPMFIFHTVVGVSMRLISGEDPPPPLKRMVQQIAPRNVLLIGANLREERELMTLYAEIGGPSFDLWFIPESKHVGAFDLHPEEYEQRVIAFFDAALLGSESSVRTP